MNDRTSANIESIPVDPDRLAPGRWCHRLQKTIGEGDIAASYSADRIGMGQPVRKPFLWNQSLCVCVSLASRGGETVTAEAYQLVHVQAFDGEPITYAAKTADGDAARADPMGFHHGMSVKHGGWNHVLCGPPLTFVPGKSEQLALF